MVCDQYVGNILTIPVAEDSMDEWDPHFDVRGLFNVKSAYRLQRQLAVVNWGKRKA
jgi:hypothetical protein